ncbi:MAG: helix-turn-helix domain-containing protein [Planctomycetota bacterium]
MEKISGLRICVHDLRGWTEANGRRQLPPGRYIHLDPFCMKVKAHPEGRRLCGESDYHRANARGLRERRPFLKKCHAGVWEMVCPIIRGNQMMGSIFCGVCRKTARVPAWPWAGKSKRRMESLYRSRPMVADRSMWEVGRILGAAVPVMLENGLGLLGARRDRISDTIMGWMGENYAEDIIVGDLARQLNLSPSRTAHVVKERTGLSFGRLVTSFRVREAKNRLRLTNDRITDIARQIGFGDSNYFSRVFSKQEGASPREFRKLRRAAGVI